MNKQTGKWFKKMGIMLATCLVVSLPAQAVPTALGGGCSVGDPTNGPMTYPDSSDAFSDSFMTSNDPSLFIGGTGVAPDGSLIRICVFSSQPTTAPDSLCTLGAEINPATPQYIAFVDTTNLTYCLYQYDRDNALADVRFNGAIAVLAAAAAAIPVSGPFVLFIMMLGLLWMGLRRRTV